VLHCTIELFRASVRPSPQKSTWDFSHNAEAWNQARRLPGFRLQVFVRMRDWVIVAGGIRRAGGQDRANLELARYLASSGRYRVSLVANRVDTEVTSFPNTSVWLVRPPMGSNVLGETLLRREARRITRRVSATAIVLANGGNYVHASANWVHCVHAAWKPSDEGAPGLRRILSRTKKYTARVAEETAFKNARVLVANSKKTARDLQEYLGVTADRIRVVYFGADPPEAEDANAGPRFRIGFVGALGWDRNKGLDIALRAFSHATRHLDPRYRLVVAGGGSTTHWRRQVERLELGDRVEFVGFVDDIARLLRSFDVLISPVRYEAYGLAVQDALVQGTPVLVSADSGVAERLSSVPTFLVTEKENPRAWSERLLDTLRELGSARSHAKRLGQELGSRSWSKMAEEIVSLVEGRFHSP
jgi:glycosyltransferase involved in cell wall biosynthesis